MTNEQTPYQESMKGKLENNLKEVMQKSGKLDTFVRLCANVPPPRPMDQKCQRNHTPLLIIQ